MKNKIRMMACFMALCLTLSIGTYGIDMAYGSIQSQINNAQDEIDDLQDKAEAADEQIEEAEKIKADLEAAVAEMDKELTAAMEEYNGLKDQQSELQSEIESTEALLKDATEKEETQYDDMKLRIQYMYEVGNQSYLELLMSSDNILDFINNAAYIVELSLYDRDMLNSYQETKQQIADSKAKLEEDNKELLTLIDDAKTKFDEVNTLVEDKQEQVEAYKAEIARLEGNKEIYEDQIEEQTAIIAELERKAAAEVQKPAVNNSSSSSSASGGSGASSENSASSSGGSSNESTSSGGGFVWPVPASSIVTSEFGYRYHPSTGKYHFHSGIDIGAATGSSILAAAGGTVTSAGWNSSMGNYVMIAHGSGLVTIYMHASVLCVSSGQTVSAGQQIALVGSTGDSTGPHLHFSVRLNGSYVSPWNYL